MPVNQGFMRFFLSNFVPAARRTYAASCLLMAEHLPRWRRSGAAEDDPTRRFATLKCRIAKSSFRGTGTMNSLGGINLLGLDIGRPDHLPAFLGFCGDEPAEVGW
jgi:hypothetical protein